MFAPLISSRLPTRHSDVLKQRRRRETQIARAETAKRGAYTPVMHPAQATHASNKIPVVVGIVVMLLIGVLAIPVKQRCGAPGYSCATALDAQGYVHYYYEVEPLGVYLAEIITVSNIRLYYTSGEELVKVR